MNRLYGRFLLKVDDSLSVIITEEEAKIYEEVYGKAQWSDELTDNLKRYEFKGPLEPYLLRQQFRTRVDWGTLVTARSRLFMNKIKRIPNIDLYYTDTDSFFLPREQLPLVQQYIDPFEWGHWKVVKYYQEVIFLGQKNYITKDENGVIEGHGPSAGLGGEDIWNYYKNALNRNFTDLYHRTRTNDFYRQGLYITSQETFETISTKYDIRQKVWQGDLWVDTKPLEINTPYIPPAKRGPKGKKESPPPRPRKKKKD